MSSCEPKGDPGDPAYLVPILVAMMPNAKGAAAFYLRQAAREFFRRSEVWRDQRISLVVPAGTTDVEVPAGGIGKIDKVVDVWAALPQGEYRLARHETEHRGHEDDSVIGYSSSGYPRWYSPKRDRITFHTPWADGLALRVHAILAPGENGAQASAEHIDEWQDAIVAGAMYRAVIAQSKKTEDIRMAGEHKSVFLEGVREAKLKYKRTFGMLRPETHWPRSESDGYGSFGNLRDRNF